MKRVFCLFSILTLCVFLLSGCGEPDVKDTLGSVYDIVSSDVVSSENSSSEEVSSDNSSEVSSEESSSSENNSSVVSSDVSSDNSSSEVSSSESSSEVESSEPENEEDVSSDNSSETNEPPPPPPPPVKKECYLTFDDGPTKNTLEILEILDRYDVKATFFVIAQNGEYMKKIVDGGHAIGLHSYTHNYSIYSSSEAYFEDLGKISDYVYNAVGQRPDIIRFAGGSSNTISMSYSKGIMRKLTKEVREKGYNYYDWNVASGDANAGSVPAATIASNVINGAKNKNSICVLMHDAAGKKTTVDALPSIIEGLKQQGFEFKVLTSDIQGFKHAVNN